MKIPHFLTSRLPTRRGRPDRPMIVAILMFLTGVLLLTVWGGAMGGRGEEHWALTALGAVSGLLLVGGCSVYLVTRIVRGVRWLRGEREPEPPPVPESAVLPAPRHRVRNFFLWLIGVPAFLVLAVVFGLFTLGQTSRRVEKVRSSLHPGMTASQVLQNTTGWFMLYASALDPERTDKGVSLTSCREGRFCLDSFEPPSQSLTEAELLERIRKMAGGGGWKFVFTYRGTTPARYSFAVVFSPDGKVKEVSPVSARD